MKRIFSIFILVLIAVGFFIAYFSIQSNSKIYLKIEFRSLEGNSIEIFYNNGQQYTEHQSIAKEYSGSNKFQDIVFSLDKDYNIQKLRLDFGKVESKIDIKRLVFYDKMDSVIILPDSIKSLFEPNNYIDSLYVLNSNLRISTFDYDPFISTDRISDRFAELRDNYILSNRIFKIALVFYILLMLFVFKTNFFKNVSLISLKKNAYLYVLTVLFLSFISVPIFVKYVGIGEAMMNRENRFPATFPDYNNLKFFDFVKEFEQYFNDNFGLRDQMVTSISYLKFKYLNVSAMSVEKISVGKDKWLFPTAYIYDIMFNLFTDDELVIVRNTIEERAIWLGEKNIKYYLVIPPSKERIYQENLPELYKNRSNLSKIDQIVEVTNGINNLVVIDLREALYSNKNENLPSLYHKYDTHWNNYGAYFGYREIVNKIRIDFPTLAPIGINSYEITKGELYEGDLLRNLAIGDLVPREEFYFDLKAGYPVYDDKPRPYLPTAVFKKSNVSNNLNVVLFGDSYSMALRSFISESFSKSVFLWTDDFLMDAIEEEQPDLIIQERMEVYLKGFLAPNPDRLIQEVELIKSRNNINQ